MINFSVARLLFVASWASTLATILGGFIMSLWSFKIAQEIRIASVDGKRNDLPTAYQLSLLVGLELASNDRLRRFLAYSHKSQTQIPPILRQTALILTLGTLLSVAVLIGDTVLHYTTATVPLDQISVSEHRSEFGRGLSQQCLELNRTENGGLPCSLNNALAFKNFTAYAAGENEISFLRLNTSMQSEIRILPKQLPARGDVATLLPQTRTLSPYTDYRSSTIGVATQCKLISEKCHFKVGGPEDFYSYFNCSPQFWGVLGKAPLLSELNTVTKDPNVSPLASKPALNVQYANPLGYPLFTRCSLADSFPRYSFFSDPDLNVVYNSVGYNLTTGLGSADIPAIPDDQLVNPVYVGIAGRMALENQLAGVDLTTQPGVFKGPNEYIDFVLNCAYETYEVSYIWSNNNVHSALFTPTPNGSLAEIFHGYILPRTISGSDADYQTFLTEAALEPTTAALAHKWANIFSIKVLAVIGGSASSRANVEEQNRIPLLVTKVPKVALSILVASCLGYAVLGAWLFYVAFSAGATTDIRDLVGRLSLPGITMYAFGQDTLTNKSRTNKVFDETAIRDETNRVGVFGDPDMGYDYKLVR
jgi:hypothetical protein